MMKDIYAFIKATLALQMKIGHTDLFQICIVYYSWNHIKSQLDVDWRH